MERQKIKNGTGRMTYLQLSNSTYISGIDFSEDKQVNAILNDSNNQCFILYPDSQSLNLSTQGDQFLEKYDKSKKHYIFIIDGTWPCAKKMLRLSENLHGLQSISFSNTKKSEFIIKQQPHELCLSTIESTKVIIEELCAIGIENVDSSSFLKPFKFMVNYQIECIKNPHNERHHHVRRKVIVEKTFYKKEGSRRLFYDLNKDD